MLTVEPLGRCVRSRRIKQAGEFALIGKADSLSPERAFALTEQQEGVRRHPHDFVGRHQPAPGNVAAHAGGMAGLSNQLVFRGY